jgi:hypothetical protein
MGIYDSTELVQNWGRFDGVQKDIFLGVKFDGVVARGLTVVEFSVLGLEPYLAQLFPEATYNVQLGESFKAPVDLLDPPAPQSIGVLLGWPICQFGSKEQFVFAKITLIALGGAGSAGDDVVVSIQRRFPPSGEDRASAHFTKCNFPFYTPTIAQTACYTINPTVPPIGPSEGCIPTAVAEETWTKVKAFYR